VSVRERHLAGRIAPGRARVARALGRRRERRGEREAHVEALRAAARPLTWDAAAERLADLYGAVVAAPIREGRRGPRDRLALEERLREVEEARNEEWRRFSAFRDEIGGDGLALVGPDGALGAQEQHALVAIADRRLLGGPLRAALRALDALATRGR
jgi:hypothetical protein